MNDHHDERSIKVDSSITVSGLSLESEPPFTITYRTAATDIKHTLAGQAKNWIIVQFSKVNFVFLLEV